MLLVTNVRINLQEVALAGEEKHSIRRGKKRCGRPSIMITGTAWRRISD